MLQRIYVHNYRTFVHFEWRPPMACVLVGANGSGKSALFDVLCMLQDVVARGKGIDESGFPATVADVAAEGNRQLIVISHHPESIDYLAADAAWKMSRDPTSGCSRIERLEPDLDAGEKAYDLVRQRMLDA